MPFQTARDLLDRAVAQGAFPAAVAEVGTATSVLWRYAAGRLTCDRDAPPADVGTVFDLASLTKVIVTATLAMRLVEAGRLSLEDRVKAWLDRWRGRDRGSVTVADLLAHASGLPAWKPLYQSCRTRTEFEAAIAALALEFPPRTRSVYSDLGFIVLGFVIEAAGGAGLPALFSERVAPALVADGADRPVGPPGGGTESGVSLCFNPPPEWRPRTAPTGVDPWRGRLLVGEVHDRNAWALGGTAGHAGLFGTAPDVGRFARAWLRTVSADRTASELASRDVARRFAERTGTPGSSRALGWDTMMPTSSCGTRLSARSIGHTGYTGTSLWIDLDRGVYVTLLTNRVHPSDANDAIKQVRPAFHDAVIEAL